MGLKLTVKEKDNPIYVEFKDAYWSIDTISFSSADNVMYVSFTLNTYPTRDAKYMNRCPIESTHEIPVGGAAKIAYDTIIRRWEAVFPVSDIFKSGIPMTELEQKRVLYAFVKAYTGLPFEDVLED